MKTLTHHIRKKQASLTTPKDLFRDESGAIDLASIMVGIIVIGLIGGVIAATVFAVIPWTQDNAAKHQLDSIVSAESAYMGLSSAVPSPLAAGYTANSYTDSPGLASANLLITNPRYCVITTNGGKGYQGFSASASGSIWNVTNSNSKPAKFNGTIPSPCQNITANTGAPVAALPAVDNSKSLKFGVTVPGGPLSNEVNTAAIAAGEFPAIVSTYKDWKSTFNSAEVQAVYDAGSQPMITWEPFDASSTAGVNQPVYKLSTIYNGQHDAYIDSWINAIKIQNTPKPILMRFAHEMNGNWYPWGSGVNGNVAGTYDSTNKYATGDYAKAWRYIHNRFTAAGVTNTKVQWVFSTNNTSANGEELWNFWPGAAYVDYNGISGFNWGTTGGPMVWQQPWEVFGSGLWHLNNDADIKGKQIIVTETGSVPTEGANTQSKWITDTVNWLSSDPGNSNVVGFVYFEYNKLEEGTTMTDWRYSTNTEASTAMKTVLDTRR